MKTDEGRTKLVSVRPIKVSGWHVFFGHFNEIASRE